jgi:predicted TIM-barrel fold metal-dependent hydrolase
MRCEPSEIDLPRVFRTALDVLGPRRLLFGTDSSFFPRGWIRSVFDTQVQVLETIGVDAEAAQGILGGNIRALLRKKS